MRCIIVGSSFTKAENSMRTLRAALAAVIICAAAISDAVSADEPARAECFQVASDGDLLLLPVRIGHKDGLMALDTGASVTLFDSSLPLGKPIGTFQAKTPGGNVALPTHEVPYAMVGKHKLQESLTRVVAADLVKLRQVFGSEFHGILGMDFLSNHVVQIDFDRGELSFLKAPDPKAGQAYPMPYQQGQMPSLVLHLSEHLQETFLLDTGLIGLDSGGIRSELCDDLFDQGNFRKVGSVLSESLAGTHRIRLFQGVAVSLGGIQFADPVFSENTKGFSRLSLRFLARHNVTLDFPRQRIYLRERKTPIGPDQFNFSGIHMLRLDGRIIADLIDRDSPAAKAGLKDGDQLLKIGDRDANQTRLFELRGMICRKGQTIRIVGARGGQLIDVSLVLKP